MKRVRLLAVISMATLLVAGFMITPTSSQTCTTIQDGTIVSKDGDPISTGYDEWGYNYGAQMFNGRYCDSDRVTGGTSCDVDLMMKWNDAWLSKKDCDGDSQLDRYFGNDSYIGSGAWLTNHMSGKVDVNGKLRKWTYFVKIVAAPADATLDGGYWYGVDGIEIGPAIWGSFAIIQQISNDPSAGEHGQLYRSPAGPGLSQY